MTTKIPFLMKQTAEQRAQLDEMAAHAGLSRTAFTQSLQDIAWQGYKARKDATAAEAQAAKAPPDPNAVHAAHCCVVCGCKYGEDFGCPVVLGTVKMSRQCSECAEELVAPTPCACDGNCAGCNGGARISDENLEKSREFFRELGVFGGKGAA